MKLLACLFLAAFVQAAPGAGIPKEARRHFIKAAAIQKAAIKPADYELAVSEYRQALELAPKYGAARYNLALALEGEGQYDEAIAELKEYLKLKPKDSSAVEDKIAALEGKAELAKTRAAEESRPKDADFSGSWYEKNDANPQIELFKTGDGYSASIPVYTNLSGSRVSCSFSDVEVSARRIKWHSQCMSVGGTTFTTTYDADYSLSDDGNELTGRRHWVASFGAQGDSEAPLYKRL